MPAARSIDERIEAHFHSLGSRRIEVPEWGDESGPLVIYATPHTVAELEDIRRESRDDSLKFLARTLVVKSRDAEGEKIFNRGHMRLLTRSAVATVVERVANQILDVEAPGETEMGN